MTAAATPYRSDLPAGRNGFAPVLHAEWTKFRTVRGWVIGAVIAGLAIVLFAYLATFRHEAGTTCPGTPPPSASSTPCLRVVQPHIPIGPSGQAVTDTYYLVHRTLDGDGSITVRVSALSGRIQTGSGNVVTTRDLVGAPAGVQPWAKAGLIVTATTRPGSPYAAIMLTGGHGVRMQYDYTHDIAAPGAPGRAPRWLRLTRSGDTLTSFQSIDGTTWTRIGAVHLTGMSTAVQAGLFVTSPQAIAQSSQQYFGSQGGVNLQFTAATAGFDGLRLRGGWPNGGWSGQEVGVNPTEPTLSSVGYQRTSAGFRISGSGDIAPAVGIPIAHTDQTALTGVFLGLIVVIVLGTMFITAEYRRGLIETTLTASPRRGRMLAAKALVIAAVTFVMGAAACAVAITLGNHILRANGNFVYPTGTTTELRVVLGTAALMAVVAVLALALGTALRRSAAAVTATIVLVVLPYLLAVASALPASVAEWLLRLTPAAAFAVEQTLPAYHQVNYLYTPAGGFYPLSPGAGLAVLCVYALAALALAHRLLRARDA